METMETIVQSERAEIVFASNGRTYRITDKENKKVRRLSKNNRADFIRNESDEYLDEAVEKNNTRILHKFLKNVFEDATLKHGRVYIRGYKMRYNSHGFELIDTWNYNEGINVNEYHNDYPCPEDVLNFLKDNIDRQIKPPKKESKRVNEIKTLARKFSVTLDKKVSKGVDTVMAAMEERKKKDMNKRAPKFVGLELEEPVDLKIVKGSIEYLVQGPSKRYWKVSTVAEFLARQLLHHFPKAMPLIMKVCDGEQFDISKINMSKFVKDKTVPYESSKLKTPVNMKYLETVCQEILWANETTTALNYIFDSKFKKDNKVRIFFADFHIWYSGVIISTDTGLRIRYEDGDVGHILKHQKIELL